MAEPMDAGARIPLRSRKGPPRREKKGKGLRHTAELYLVSCVLRDPFLLALSSLHTPAAAVCKAGGDSRARDAGNLVRSRDLVPAAE